MQSQKSRVVKHDTDKRGAVRSSVAKCVKHQGHDTTKRGAAKSSVAKCVKRQGHGTAKRGAPRSSVTKRAQRDTVERLAFSAAKRLRKDLALAATANEHASGYGTVCLTGHPIVEGLWLHCVTNHPERALVEEERAATKQPSTQSEQLCYAPGHGLPRLPMVLHYNGGTAICLTTRMWALDELRALAQHEPSDGPRTLLDTKLAQLNHGDMPVTIHFTDLVSLLKEALKTLG